jgi:CTP:molybdopterin cytidylyltransferase MocA
MKLAMWKAASAITVIGVLLAAGMGTMMISASADQDNLTGTVAESVANETLYNLTVRVGGIAEGNAIGVSEVTLEVWSVNITENDTYKSIVLQKVAEAVTDENGNATFTLSAGDYLIVANNSGQVSAGQLTMENDQSVVLLLHGGECHGPRPHMRCEQNCTT